jgi:hypothetical protein
VVAQDICRLPRYHTEEESHLVSKTESNCYSIDQRRAYARWDQANVGRVYGAPYKWWIKGRADIAHIMTISGPSHMFTAELPLSRNRLTVRSASE